MPEALKIILFSMAAAMIYGILHDMVTAHLCVEYFTVAHPMIIPTTSPFLLALFWGVFATWWVGLFLGAGLALAARLGSAPKLSLGQLRRPILLLMVLSALAALLAGAAGALLMANDRIALDPWLAGVLPPDRRVVFVAAASAHLASYGAGGVGGLLFMALAVRKRLKQAVSPRPSA